MEFQVGSLWLGYGSYDDMKGYLQYVVSPLSLRTIAHTLEHVPFRLWFSFGIGPFVKMVGTLETEWVFKTLAKIVAVVIPYTWSTSLIYKGSGQSFDIPCTLN